MTSFTQEIPRTEAQAIQQVEALLTIDALETNPNRRANIPKRAEILSRYLYLYEDAFGLKHNTYKFITRDNQLCLSSSEPY